MVRHASKFRHLLYAILLSAGVAAADGLQPIDQIEAAALGAAQRQLPAPGAQQKLFVGPVDARLRLPLCADPLQTRIGPGLAMRDRTLVEISCAASPTWRTFVPVRIVGIHRAVFLARPVVAGQTLKAQDLATLEGDAAQFPLGYFDDPAAVIGMTVRRAAAKGLILSNQLLLATDTIVRGQEVTLLASLDGLNVRMPGRALSDGMINQRIKVRNISSGRIVEGIARSQQLVEINSH